MVESVVEPKPPDRMVSQVFVGRMRWLAAGVLVAGALLQAVEFLVGNFSTETAARVAYWAAHQRRIELSMISGLLAVPFLFGGFAVLATLSWPNSPRLAWTAATLLTFAMVGLAGIHGYELAAYGLVRSGNLAAAAATLNGDSLGLPGAVFFLMFLSGAVFGTVALAAAVWRSRYVPRIVAACIIAFAILDFVLGQGVASHLVNLLGFSIAAGALVLGYVRQPHHRAHPIV